RYRIVLRPNAFEVPCGRVARVAFPRPIEIRLARLRIPGHDVENPVRAAQSGVLDPLVQESRYIRNLLLRHGEFRHALVEAAIENHGPNLLAFIVIEHDYGAQQIRAAFTPFGVGAVAEAASRHKHPLPAFDGGLVVLGVASSAATAATAGSGFAWRSRRTTICAARRLPGDVRHGSEKKSQSGSINQCVFRHLSSTRASPRAHRDRRDASFPAG